MELAPTVSPSLEHQMTDIDVFHIHVMLSRRYWRMASAKIASPLPGVKGMGRFVKVINVMIGKKY